MVFQFEHMDVDADGENKWTDKKMDLRDLKEVMSRWEIGLDGIAWNSLFFENHDQPRSVSRFGNDKEYWEDSAKMLATCLHMMQGTPYIYQGQEIGMTNAPFKTIEDFRDLDSVNAYYELVGKNIFTHEEMMKYLCYKSRDNARTPFQWDDSKNAGFTNNTPWIMVNPNYKKINAKEQMEREDSIFRYYQKLIQLRKQEEIIVYGSYELLYTESKELYVYTRTLGEEKLLVVCNFSKQEVEFILPKEFENARCLIRNKQREWKIGEKVKPYEAFVLKK